MEITLSLWMLVPFLWVFLNLLAVFISCRKYGVDNFELFIIIYVAVFPSLLMILAKQMP